MFTLSSGKIGFIQTQLCLIGFMFLNYLLCHIIMNYAISNEQEKSVHGNNGFLIIRIDVLLKVTKMLSESQISCHKVALLKNFWIITMPLLFH